MGWKNLCLVKCVFFDRDGVVNQRTLGGYICVWNDFHFLPGIGEALRGVKDLGYLAVVVTNQRGVGKGLMSPSDLDAIHERMQAELLSQFGVQFDWINSCTDAADETGRRKPSPAMLFEARDKFGIEMSRSWMIGDTASDIQAGRRAGVKTAFLKNEHEAVPADVDVVLESVTGILSHLAR